MTTEAIKQRVRARLDRAERRANALADQLGIPVDDRTRRATIAVALISESSDAYFEGMDALVAAREIEVQA